MDGVRNPVGKVNANGSVTLYAVTSAVGGLTDYGADPNKLGTITDNPAATTLPNGERFSRLRIAATGDVYRGVSFTPGSKTGCSVSQSVPKSVLCRHRSPERLPPGSTAIR